MTITSFYEMCITICIDPGESVILTLQRDTGKLTAGGYQVQTMYQQATGLISAENIRFKIPSSTQSGERQIENAFVALKADGSVVTWGSGSFGGMPAYSYYDANGNNVTVSVADQLKSGVTQIFSSGNALSLIHN